MAKNYNIFGIVLAGGEGKRLLPLTVDRAKPAVPFGGQYRLIDFTLSNLLNSNLRQIVVLTQYKSHSLDRHISQTWRLPAILNAYITSVPAQQRLGKRWFSGSADAILQNLNIIREEKPDIVIVTGADHIYRMDFRQMVQAHLESGAEATIAAIRQPVSLGPQLGVIELKSQNSTLIKAFHEKPQRPPTTPKNPNEILASMGSYVFNASALVKAVVDDGDLAQSTHDMGKDIIPQFVEQQKAHVYDFQENTIPGEDKILTPYWRDVGSIDSFFDAHQDLVAPLPAFNLYNEQWPIFSQQLNSPPAKITHDNAGNAGSALDSIISLGSLTSGACLERTVLGPWGKVYSQSHITDSVIFDHVAVGAHTRIHRAILDKRVVVHDHATIGIDPEHDRRRGFTITENGVTVVQKNIHVHP